MDGILKSQLDEIGNFTDDIKLPPLEESLYAQIFDYRDSIMSSTRRLPFIHLVQEKQKDLEPLPTLHLDLILLTTYLAIRHLHLLQKSTFTFLRFPPVTPFLGITSLPAYLPSSIASKTTKRGDLDSIPSSSSRWLSSLMILMSRVGEERRKEKRRREKREDLFVIDVKVLKREGKRRERRQGKAKENQKSEYITMWGFFFFGDTLVVGEKCDFDILIF